MVDIIAQIFQDAQLTAPFIQKYGVDTWSKIHHAIGREDGLTLVDKDRKEIITILRVEYGMTLQAVGNIWGLTRERIRQLTPPGIWHSDSEEIDWDKITERVARSAANTRLAWGSNGRVSRKWVLEKFGSDVARHLPGIHRKINKLELILRYRVGLKNRGACLEWLNEHYYKRGNTFEGIAKKLSAMIPISTMCVYRSARAMGFRGYNVGRRPDEDNLLGI